MKYTVRFAHMKEPPKWKRGDVIKTGDVIAIHKGATTMTEKVYIIAIHKGVTA